MRFRSLALELIILFVAVVIVSQVIALAYRYDERTKALAALEAVRIADRIVTIMPLVEKAPPEERTNLVKHFQGSFLPLSWSKKSWIGAHAEEDANTRLLRNLLTDTAPEVAGREIRVSYISSSETARDYVSKLSANWRSRRTLPEPLSNIIDEFVKDPTYLVSVRLQDGTWLNIVAAYVDTLEFWPLKAILILGVMVVTITTLSIWAIRRLTAPFRVFARAAARLGTDVNAPPIEEHGAVEVREAIQAFNAMQRKLQRFIEDRTLMLAGVSHDLRTPITRLKLRAELFEDATQRAKAIGDLNEMERMISEFLTFAKDDSSVEPMASVELGSLLQRICDEMADDGWAASFEEGGRVSLLCRPRSLRRCFVNVINNAAKYGMHAMVRLETAENEVAVLIDDRGPGIAEELQEKAFRPFFRLDPSRSRESGGSGLGLTIARTIARAHGGDVILQNRPGGGLRVKIVLPKNEDGTGNLKAVEAVSLP